MKANMNEVAAYLKAYQWLGTAVSDGSDITSERHKVLTSGRIIEWDNREVAVTADGYHMHILWNIPHLLRESAVQVDGQAPVLVFADTLEEAFALNFPSLEHVLGIDFEPPTLIDRVPFGEMLAEGFECDGNFSIVYLRRTANKLILSGDPRFGDFNTMARCSPAAPDFDRVVLRGEYLLAALAGFEERNVPFSISADNNTIRIGEVGKQCAVIMTMTLRGSSTGIRFMADVQ